MKFSKITSLSALVLSFGIFTNCLAEYEEKISAIDAGVNDNFGYSVSVSGDYAVIGTPNSDEGGSFSGSANIYKRDGSNWTQQSKLTVNDLGSDDFFGNSVSIDGDYVAIGAYYKDDPFGSINSGSVYIFKRIGKNWLQEARLTASDAAQHDHFGVSVSISGDYVIVGANYDDPGVSDGGSAYIFKRTGTTWTEEAKISASDATQDDEFGRSVSISGDYAVVGSRYDDDNGLDSGSAYIFKRNGAIWTEETKIYGNDTNVFDEFGNSVFIDGDYIIVGAMMEDTGGSEAGSAYIFKRTGANWAQEKKLTAIDAAQDDNFGYSVALNGDYALIGAYGNDDAEINSGSAYIFNRTGTNWTQEEKLTASDADLTDRFGFSVAINGIYAFTSAPQDDEVIANSGSVYIFESNGINWTEQLKLARNDTYANDRFGSSVSIDGDYLAVGTPFNDDSGTDVGSAYIFAKNDTNWFQQSKLLANDGDVEDEFGCSVSISGDYAIIGAYKDDVIGSASGSAYFFKRTGTDWEQEEKIIASDASGSDEFGISVSIDGDYAVVGAHENDDAGNNSGSAYIFKRSGKDWSQEAKLTASDASSNDHFGYSVAISGDYAIVGAYNDDDSGSNSGSAYIFKRTGVNWVQEDKLTASDAFAGDFLGSSVAINGDYAIIGAADDDDAGSSSGSAYIFKRTGVNWAQEKKLTASDAASGDVFGWSVAINGDYATVGAPGDNNASGATYVFLRSGTDWSQKAKKTSSDAASGDVFGWSVAISGNYLISGAESDDDGGSDSGSAYIFTANDGDNPLSVELDSFQARQIKNTIQLNWSTASETENEGFNVYRKTATSEFIQIASYRSHNELLGQGNSTFQNNYTFVDNSDLENGKYYTYVISDVETSGIETKHNALAQTLIFEAIQNQTAKRYKLAQNFPNPFNPTTTISYQIAKDTRVSLKIYNINGEFVKELTNGFQQEGSHSVVWNGTDISGKSVSSGTYFYKLQAGTFTQTNKMILLK